MRSRFFALAILCYVISLLRLVWPDTAFVPIPAKELQRTYESCSAETRLALGGKIPFRTADLYDLELIPGVSDTLGHELLTSRQVILVRMLYLPPEKQYTALEMAKGVGPKTAEELKDWLSFEQ